MRRKTYSIFAFALIALLALTGWSTHVQAQEQITIPVGDSWFCDPADEGGECVTDIYAGDTVVWDFSSSKLPHTVTHCGESCETPTGTPLWDSGLINDGSAFSFTFDETGSYAYHCEVHPQQQFGRIEVHEGEPPPTQTAVVISPPFEFIGTPAVTPTAFPDTGARPADGSPELATSASLVLGALALLLTSGALVVRGRKVRS